MMMMKMKMLSLLPVFLFSAAINATPLSPRDKPKFVPGKYLVQLRSDINAVSVASHHETVHRLARRSAADSPIERTFSIGSLNAYLGAFDEQAATDISDLEEVISVVPDEYIYLEKTDFPPLAPRALVTQPRSIWSLGDLSHKAGNSTDYVYDASAGMGTTAYVFDTGIRLTHTEFEGRARFGINGVTNSTAASGASKDDDGHGTHCAATVVGKTFGVAKKASVVDVKIFDGAVGSTSATLTGIQWAVADVLSRRAASTSVFSMSLGAQTTSTLIDDAVKAAYDAGILSVVAAGNENSPIAPTSPARLPQAFTVGMTQPDRGRVDIIENVYGSNYGPEMDVFAPGRDIVSASHLSDTGNATKTGTSMSTPLVAGLVCYLRAFEGGLVSPDQVTSRVLKLAVTGVVKDPKGSPNILVYNGSGA
ncbi:alkaline serine protease Alp1 [Karstenula rhodostoma CBS 690.94]|uniref:Alkaline serine protease Alp1 n=1 Tax=Karstenula rhodostoma CBS 690.94 TaxID=1392251 RepID=A0A9P4PRE6_9PLEO|nr:alkaline serine protease Alp1 [Karstenula rhodostoma CBS 690.94]